MKPVSRPDDRYFDPNPQHKKVALELYHQVKDLPLICPHGHVDPECSPTPTIQLWYAIRFVDHSRPLRLHDALLAWRAPGTLGVPSVRWRLKSRRPSQDMAAFADNFYLFRGTPTGMWIKDELHWSLNRRKAEELGPCAEIYDSIEAKLKTTGVSSKSAVRTLQYRSRCVPPTDRQRLPPWTDHQCHPRIPAGMDGCCPLFDRTRWSI